MIRDNRIIVREIKKFSEIFVFQEHWFLSFSEMNEFSRKD